jgi:hypothetical protein
MLKLTLRFQRKTGGPTTDDILTVYDDDEFYEMQRIEYKPGEYSRRQFQYFLEQEHTLEYLADLLKMLTLDADPFEYIQIDTPMHPSVLYHISELDTRETRWFLEDIFKTVLRRPIRTIKQKTDAPRQ